MDSGLEKKLLAFVALAAELSIAVDRGAGEIAIGHGEYGSASAAK
jgi:hypothetical protein